MARRLSLPVLLLIVVAACDLPQAHGDANAIIVGAVEADWLQVEDRVLDQLEPTIQTVTDERAYRVQWYDPSQGGRWTDLRKFRQVLVVGTETDLWIEQALESYDGTPSAPALVSVRNVWSRDQNVHIAVVDDPEDLLPLLGDLHQQIDEQFRRHTFNRMFTSGRDTILADSLRREVGFALTLPNVYRYSVQDSAFRFRNDNPTPSERIREIGVTWRTPIPDTLPDRDGMIEWRTNFAAEYYPQAQRVLTHLEAFREMENGVELQASWSSPEDAWPAGGPFISRAIVCPDQNRLYHLDAWLYSPGTGKYEYMIQLQTILDSFECG